MDKLLPKIVLWVTLAALFIIPFLPLYVNDSLFFPFITGKNFAFRILVEIALAGWILLMLVDAQYRPRFSWTGAIFGLFVIWMAIADAFAVNPAKAFWSNFERMDGFVTLIHVFALFLIAGAVFSVARPVANMWRAWWLTFLGVAALVCIYALGQSFGLLAIHQGSTRVDATFGNSEYLAAYMLFVSAIALWQGLETRGRAWLKYGLYVLCAVSIVILFLTETRGAILALVGAIVIGAILWMIEAGRKGRMVAGSVLIVMAALTLLFFGIRTTPLAQEIPGVDRLASISASNSESTTRLTIWYMALEGAVQKPITGWGQEGFNYVFNQYYQPSLYQQEPWFDRAHDIFLDWLVAGGVPALILFVALLATAVVGLYRSTVSRTERIVLMTLIVGYAMQGIFVFDNLFTYVPLAIILAMAHTITSRPIERFSTMKSVANDIFTTFCVPIVCIGLVLVIYVVNVPNIRAASDIIDALTQQDPTSTLDAFKQAYADGSFANQEITEQLMTYATGIAGSQTISNADKTSVFTYAFQQMQALVTAIPHDARIHFEYALGLRAAGQYPLALEQIHIAEQESPEKQSMLTEEGIEDWENNDVADAQTAFNKAYTLDPAFKDLAAYAAAGDIAAGQVPVGKAILMQSYGTTTVDAQEIIVAYYNIKDYPDLITILHQYVIDQGSSSASEFALAAAYANEGDLTDARAEVQTAIKEHPDAATQGAQLLSEIQGGSSS